MLNACFRGVSAKTEVHRPNGFRNIFAAIDASDVYKCILAVKLSICSHIPLLWAGVTNIILLLFYQLYQLLPLFYRHNCNNGDNVSEKT